MNEPSATKPRSLYITHNLDPVASAGENRQGAATNQEWLRAECDRARAAGMGFVVVSTPTGTQALAREGQVHHSDAIIYPEHLRADT